MDESTRENKLNNQNNFYEKLNCLPSEIEEIVQNFEIELPKLNVEKLKEEDGSKIYDLACLYYFGKSGYPKDYEKAKNLFELSAEKGFAKSYHKIAFMYEEGHGFIKDYKKAKEYYEKAIEKNCSLSLNNLAILYEQGLGVEQNPEKAKELYEKAIITGCKNAMYNLAKNYEDGSNGFQENPEKAFELYQLAVKRGEKDALFQVALCYEEGKGVEKNHRKAIKYYKKAIKKDEFDSIFNLGLLYRQEENLENAIKIFEYGRSRGCSKSINSLALLYKDGNGVKKDIKKTIELLEESIRGMNYKAMENLADLYKEGIYIPLNLIESKRLYRFSLFTLENNFDFDDEEVERINYLSFEVDYLIEEMITKNLTLKLKTSKNYFDTFIYFSK